MTDYPIFKLCTEDPHPTGGLRTCEQSDTNCHGCTDTIPLGKPHLHVYVDDGEPFGAHSEGCAHEVVRIFL